MKKTIKKFYDGYSKAVYTADNWACGLEDDNDKDTNLALIVEITDTRDYDDNPDNDYPYGFSISIVSAEISDAEIIRAYGDDIFKGTQVYRILESYGYRGGVPVDYKMMNLADTNNYNWRETMSCNDAKIKTIKNPKYGTLAANGISEYKYPMFADDAKCLEFAEDLINRYADVIFMMIGFYLDCPVNMAGETGWEKISEASK